MIRPRRIVCPVEATAGYVPSLWSIMSKVRWEAFLWGAGTALGELPPYFMAKASRLSGYDPDDEDEELKEFEELNKKSELGVDLSLMERAKIFMERAVEKVGFLGILACASVSELHSGARNRVNQLRFDLRRFRTRSSTWPASLAATFWCRSGRSLVQHFLAKL